MNTGKGRLNFILRYIFFDRLVRILCRSVTDLITDYFILICVALLRWTFQSQKPRNKRSFNNRICFLNCRILYINMRLKPWDYKANKSKLRQFIHEISSGTKCNLSRKYKFIAAPFNSLFFCSWRWSSSTSRYFQIIYHTSIPILFKKNKYLIVSMII